MDKTGIEVVGGASVLERIVSLLPCPFCGEQVTMGASPQSARIEYFQVECECGAIAGSAYTTEQAAAKNWNRRANAELRDRPLADGPA
jgi:Lar family restriction alleviation protein